MISALVITDRSINLIFPLSGRELEITTSEYSLPTIAKEDQDWFSTLQEMMNWNVRARQKKIQTKNKTDQ